MQQPSKLKGRVGIDQIRRSSLLVPSLLLLPKQEDNKESKKSVKSYRHQTTICCHYIIRVFLPLVTTSHVLVENYFSFARFFIYIFWGNFLHSFHFRKINPFFVYVDFLILQSYEPLKLYEI